MQPAELECRCGKVKGRVTGASPEAANRIVCYCDDCQAFLHYLGRADLLDPHGGSDIVQVAPASLTFERGSEQITAVRLTPKGMHRWYAACCKTPLGNTLTPAIPFVGMIVNVFGPARADQLFGKPQGRVFGKFAIGEPPEGSTKFNLRLMGRAVRNMVGWKFTGRAWPHPFFNRETREPAYPVTVLTTTERDALRPLCGPHAHQTA